jgi:pyrroloquinoline-quinone synthase
VTAPALSFVDRLRAEGLARYHHMHPFNVRMHAGALRAEEIRCWVANRYYYQTRIPIKDALIVAKAEDRAFRQAWIRRIHDHDDAGGGLDLWCRLGEAVGIPPDELVSCRRVLPGVRAACDAYVELVARVSLVEAVASSLTEAFAPDLMRERILAWEEHYPWVDARALDYFRVRVGRARRDADEALRFVVAGARTRELEDRCVAALVEKTSILWRLLDCVEEASA